MGKLPVKLGAVLVVLTMAGAAIVSLTESRALPGRLLLCGPDERLLVEQPESAPAELRGPGGLAQQFVCVDRRGIRRRAGWS
jgi:hypothetical protein